MFDDYLKPSKSSMCQHCHNRKATIQWIGTGGIMDALHGMFEMWCERCTLEAQITYAEEHKSDLERLKKELEIYDRTHKL